MKTSTLQGGIFIYLDGSSAAISGSYSIPNGDYHIVSALDSDRCLHATGTNNGDNIDLGSLSEDSNTTFYINWIGDGYYEIGPSGSGRFVDVAGAHTGDGTNIQVWEGVGNDYQKWIIKDAGDGYFYILSRADGYALDVVASSTARGTNVTTWTNQGGANQKWRFELVGGSQGVATGEYNIVSALDCNRCLHATGLDNGNNIDLGSLLDDSNVSFYVKNIGSGYYEIGPSSSGRFLDIAGAGMYSGCNVQVWEGVGNNHQKWVLHDLGDGWYDIRSKGSGHALDVSGGVTERGTNIQVWVPNGNDSQRWRFVPVAQRLIDDGDYRIVSALAPDRCLHVTGTNNGDNADLGSTSEDDNTVFAVKWSGQGGYYEIAPKGGRYLDVAGATTGSGVNVQVWDGVGINYQKWIIVKSGTGYSILSKASGLALDVSGGGTSRGTNVQTWIAHGGASQVWTFAKVAASSKSGDTSKATSIAKAAISGLKAKTYNGKAQTQSPTVKLGNKTLKAGTDYSVSYENNVKAGAATVTVKGKGSYTGTKSATFKINKAANPITVKAKSPSVKASKVKKANQSIVASKAFTVSKAQGKVAYKKASGNKKITVSSAGKITVKKGLKKGTYKVKAKVTAKGNANYKVGSKTVTVKVKVK